MARITRFKNLDMEAQGFDAWGQRQPVPLNVDDERLDNDQQLTDNALPGSKLKDLTVDKLLAGSLQVTTYIKSSGFDIDNPTALPGWYIAGDGNATFNNITLIGGALSYGKTSFADSAASGYWIGPAGVYFGAASDSTYLKYDIGGNSLTVLGTLATAPAPGKRIVISSATNDLTFYSAANQQLLQLGGDGATTNIVKFTDVAPTPWASVDARRSVGTGGSFYAEVDYPGGPVYTAIQHSNTPAVEFVTDSAGQYAVPLFLYQSLPVAASFYRTDELHGGGVFNPAAVTSTLSMSRYIGNGDPNGTVNSTAGSIMQTPTGFWLCLGATVWAALATTAALTAALAALGSTYAALGSNSDITGLWATRFVTLKPYGTGVGNTGETQWFELAANGTNYIAFKAPDALAGTNTYTLPSANGSASDVLSIQANETLEWTRKVKNRGFNVTAVGTAPAVHTVNFANGEIANLSANNATNTINMSGFVTTVGYDGGKFVVAVTNFTGAAYTITWSPTIKWRGGTAPTPTPTNLKTDIYTFLQIGGTLYGDVGLNF